MGAGKRKQQWVPCRVDDVVSRSVGDELVVYTPGNAETHALNETAAVVFGAVDGHRNVDDLVGVVSNGLGKKVDEAVVFAALSQLSESGLTTAPPARWDRRDVLRTVGLAGVVAAPVIASVALPSVADAQSGGTGGTGGGPGACVLQTATTTLSGDMYLAGYTAPTAFDSVGFNLVLAVTGGTTTITSGTLNTGDIAAPYDLSSGPIHSFSGSGTIVWDDLSTSAVDFDVVANFASVGGQPPTWDLDLIVTSGMFAPENPGVSTYPQSTAADLIPSNPFGSDPLTADLTNTAPLSFEGCGGTAPTTTTTTTTTTTAPPTLVVSTFVSGIPRPWGMDIVSDGTLYVSDPGRVLKITPGGSISVLAGEHDPGLPRRHWNRRAPRPAVGSPSLLTGPCMWPTGTTTGFARSRRRAW